MDIILMRVPCPRPQARSLGLHKRSPPSRTKNNLHLKPAEAGFVSVAATSVVGYLFV
jgi:hypothetical protein